MECYELFSCFCLFDECCLSKYERESYKDLLERISPYEKKRCWSVRVYGDSFRPEKRYVCCINHASRIIYNIVLSQLHKINLKNDCLRFEDDQSVSNE